MSADASRFINTEDGVSVRVQLLVRTIAGSVAFSGWMGLINMITSFGGGVTTSITHVGAWLSAFIDALFWPVTVGFGFASASEFVETFGVLGQVLAGAYVTTFLAATIVGLSALYGVLSTARGG